MKTIIQFLIVSSFVLTQISIAQWVQTNTGLTNTDVRALAVSPNGVGGTNLFAGPVVGGIFLSTNNGTTWSAVNNGLPKYPPDTTRYDSFHSFVVVGTNLFAGSSFCGVFLTTNNGASWDAVNNGLPMFLNSTNRYFDINLAVSGKYIFAGTWGWYDYHGAEGVIGKGVFRSSNSGSSWTQTNLDSMPITSIAVSNTNLLAATYFGDVIFRSTDNGTSWSAVSAVSIGLTNTPVRCFATYNTVLFAGAMVSPLTDGGGGVYFSTNAGESWSSYGSGHISIYALALSDMNLFAIGEVPGNNHTYGVYLYSNPLSVATFEPIDTYLMNTIAYALAVKDTYLFAATDKGVWRRPLSEMMGVVQHPSELPTQFSLQQNYPNPFNPATVISYQLPLNSYVTLKVYDLLGREVATLVDERKDAGSYSVQWNASGFATGIYLVRIQAHETNGQRLDLSSRQAGSFIETKKVLLMK